MKTFAKILLAAGIAALPAAPAFAASACSNPNSDFDQVYCYTKLFIQADSKARMERRARQFEIKGLSVDRYALYHQIEERDARDRANPHGGFYPAPDAHLLDTTRLGIEAALRAAVAIVDGVMAEKSRSERA